MIICEKRNDIHLENWRLYRVSKVPVCRYLDTF